ncbi:uncharacterized protein K452DRAFT_229176 [Aplosporella prunicola CBS 121167]|uniref:Amidase domain-containing protein n=1 Tax=Aplosporella prunicola CBS 121167 TaxID=1176127 RepID=A0A6A6BAT0_9PEZI|nr:uncharacterized protein K452DRAFT_229176 [Aplosporella prunicola CBS 121167]KAF2141126.1 hypothetical protein K452DRAFT_229176 [Aplosporella prunicola CBS 121167]
MAPLRGLAGFLLAFTLIACGKAIEVHQGLLDATIEDLQAGMRQGFYTSLDLVNAYTARISEVNNELRAVTEINPDAWDIAFSLDQDRQRGHIRGTLHGIPILVKDSIGTFDKMNTTAGTYALLGTQTQKDAMVVKKLRDAGAVILGKTNLSQFSGYRSRNSSNGWSAYGGQATGPYYPNQDPSGSSSGSAVAAALALSLGALGTETNGSIILPAAKAAVVGIKPTVGLTSRYNVVPVSPFRDTVGPIAPTVKDAAYMLQVIMGSDVDDEATLFTPYQNTVTIPKYVDACDPNALQGTRIGVPDLALIRYWQGGFISLTEVHAFYAALDELEAAGAEVVREANIRDFDKMFYHDRNDTLIAGIELGMQGRSTFDAYLRNVLWNPKHLWDLHAVVEIMKEDPREEYPERDTAFIDYALNLNLKKTSPQYLKAVKAIEELGAETGGLLGTLRVENLTAVVLPTSISHRIAAYANAPVVTVPMGYFPKGNEVVKTSWGLVERAEGIPFGIAFMGNPWKEQTLIGLAYAYEQRTQWRKKRKLHVAPTTNVIGKNINVEVVTEPPTTNGTGKNINIEVVTEPPATNVPGKNVTIEVVAAPPSP